MNVIAILLASAAAVVLGSFSYAILGKLLATLSDAAEAGAHPWR